MGLDQAHRSEKSFRKPWRSIRYKIMYFNSFDQASNLSFVPQVTEALLGLLILDLVADVTSIEKVSLRSVTRCVIYSITASCDNDTIGLR